jgi:hypothetical protein
MIGLYYLPKMFIAHETGLTLEEASKGLQRLSEVGYAHYDEASEVVWVENMAHEQVGESLSANDNKIKAVWKDYKNAPMCSFLGAFFDKYVESFHLESRRGFEGAPEGLQRGFEGASEGLQRGSEGASEGLQRGSEGASEGLQRGSEGASKPVSSSSSSKQDQKEKPITIVSTTQELTTGEPSPALVEGEGGEEVVISLPDKIPIEELKSLCRESLSCFAKALPSAAVTELKRMRDSYRRDQIEHAFSEAAKSGATSLNYVFTVLKRMPQGGRIEDDPRYEAIVGKK